MSYPPPRITPMTFDGPTDRVGLLDDMDGAMGVILAASAKMLRAVARYDREERWRADGATSMSGWLAARYRLAWGTAREWVRVAHALEVLPRVARAHAKGRLSWDQLRPLTRFATQETDLAWSEKAPGLRPAALWREARRHERMRLREAEEHHRSRYLSLTWDPERPILWLEGMLPAEAGATLESALAHRAERLPGDPQARDAGGARLADALLDLTTASDPQPATVVVHAGAEALLGREPKRGPWLAETETGQRLCSAAVRRLACDGRIEWLLESHGRSVGIGRRGRTVPGAIGRLLRHRDRTCRFPGCERKRWLHAHHLVHWADGGATNLDNLVLLCHFHHRLIHEGGWRTSGHPAWGLRFHDPRGRALAAFPAPARHRPAAGGAKPISQPLRR